MKHATTSLSTLFEEENQDQVKLLRKIPGFNDNETNDGLTAFAISLVKQSKDIVMAILNSGIGLHPRIASEICRLPYMENEDLQSSVRKLLLTQKTETVPGNDPIMNELDMRQVLET